jgi:hypothetical protein
MATAENLVHEEWQQENVAPIFSSRTARMVGLPWHAMLELWGSEIES